MGGFFADRRLRRALSRLERSDIRDVVDRTKAKISGRIQAVGAPLRAPLSGRECVYYDVLVDEGRRTSWRFEVVREARQQDFVVVDETGLALIRVDCAQVHGVLDFEADGRSQNTDDLLSRHGQSAVGMLLPRRLRFRECVLQPGQLVTVAGMAVREPDPDPTAGGAYREPATRIVLCASKEVPLLVSDEVWVRS